MILLLYGSDTARSQKKLQEIIEEYRNKYGGLDVHKFDVEEEPLEKIKRVFETDSLFSAKKLVVLKYFSQSPQKDELYNILEKVKDDSGTTIILWDRELGEKELGKLRDFCKKTQEFKELKRELPEASVFQLGDTFFTSPKSALQNLLHLLSRGHDDFSIFSYLASHARQILAVQHFLERKRPVPSSQGIHPFVVKKITVLVPRLAPGKIQEILGRFFEEDRKIKTGLSSPRDSLVNILVGHHEK